MIPVIIDICSEPIQTEMNIIDFLNSESQKYEHLENKNRASALLNSVKNELVKNGTFTKADAKNILTDTVAMVEFMNKSEYALELQVTKYLLEFYEKTGTFKVLKIPYPNTKKDNARYDSIKKHLEGLFL